MREEVAAERDVLRRRRDRAATGRREDVVRRQHEHARFHLRLDRKRHVHRHLVTVEVGIVSRADERVNADRRTLDQDRLEGLNRQTVQGRRAVEHDRVPLVTSSRMSQTSGVLRSIIFLAERTVCT